MTFYSMQKVRKSKCLVNTQFWAIVIFLSTELCNLEELTEKAVIVILICVYATDKNKTEGKLFNAFILLSSDAWSIRDIKMKHYTAITKRILSSRNIES